MAARHVRMPRLNVLRDVGWENMRVISEDDKVFYILGYIAGKWKLTRRDGFGKPVPFSGGVCEKKICSGVLGDADIEVEDGFISVVVPIHMDDDSFSEFWSDDDGETWQKQEL